MEIDPFSVFNTTADDVESYEEPEAGVDYSKIFYEPDPRLVTAADSKGEHAYRATIKLVGNIYDPKHPVQKLSSYTLPRPDNPAKKFFWPSPTTINRWDLCPVATRWSNNRKSEDPRLKSIADTLKRKNSSCCVIQVISDAVRPQLNGQFFLMRFPSGMDIDNLIKNMIDPSAEDMAGGKKKENVFDFYDTRYLKLKVLQGDKGRDFSQSEFTPKFDDDGRKITGGIMVDGKILTENDRPSDNDTPEEKARKRAIQVKVAEFLKQDNVNIKKYFSFEMPNDEARAYCERALRVIFGEEAPTGQNVQSSAAMNQSIGTEQQAQPVAQASAPIAPAPTTNAEPAPAVQSTATQAPAATVPQPQPVPQATAAPAQPAPQAEQVQNNYSAATDADDAVILAMLNK